MSVFNILQILFDAVFLFGILFLFNFSISQTRKKDDDLEVMKSAQTQEIKEQLQDLLLTLKQLGNEVSENIQKEVRIAEEKTDLLQRLFKKIHKEIEKTDQLKSDLDDIDKSTGKKVAFLRASKTGKIPATKKRNQESSSTRIKNQEKVPLNKNESGMHGLSSEIVREVYRLVDTDNDLKTICEKTQLSLAEIQLILNLRGNRFTTPN